MDNLTHSLVGLVASKAGLERLSPATSAVCIVASNAPDADILSLIFGDRWTYLHHHRGITHSLLGTLVLALLIPSLFFLGDRLLARFRQTEPKLKLAGLMIASLVVSATHPLMDWTNNYGIRPWLPWNRSWVYGDLVFIVDPFIWIFLGSAAFPLTSKTTLQKVAWLTVAAIVTSLVLFVSNRPGVTTLGAVRIIWLVAIASLIVLWRFNPARMWGRGIGITAFFVLIFYWCGLAVLHRVALGQATQQAWAIGSGYGESVVDVAAMPTLANPFRWQSVVETERAAYRFDVFLLGGSNPANFSRHERPDAATSPLISRVLNDRRAVIFLEFARFPVARVADPDCTTQTLVQLADLRYTEPGNQRGTFALQLPVECTDPLR
jgi:inner membrane protein